MKVLLHITKCYCQDMIVCDLCNYVYCEVFQHDVNQYMVNFQSVSSIVVMLIFQREVLCWNYCIKNGINLLLKLEV